MGGREKRGKEGKRERQTYRQTDKDRERQIHRQKDKPITKSTFFVYYCDYNTYMRERCILLTHHNHIMQYMEHNPKYLCYKIDPLAYLALLKVYIHLHI